MIQTNHGEDMEKDTSGVKRVVRGVWALDAVFPSESPVFHFLFRVSRNREIPLDGNMLKLVGEFNQMSAWEKANVLSEMAPAVFEKTMKLARVFFDQARKEELANEPLAKVVR